MPSGPGFSPVVFDLRGEMRPVELQRRQFSIDGRIEFGGRSLAAFRQLFRRGPISRPGGDERLLEAFETKFAGVEGGDLGRETCKQFRQRIGRRGMFPCRSSQGEQPLLYGLEFSGVEGGIA